MIQTIIIDKNINETKVLEQILLENHPSINILITAVDVLSGIKNIHKFNPDLVFINAELPVYNGFQLLDQFENPTFQVIFTSSNSKHALKAIKTNAIAYLLKPINPKGLKEAIEKVEKNITQNSLFKKSETPINLDRKITFSSKDGMIYLFPKEILYLTSMNHKTIIHLVNESKIIANQSLKEIESLIEKSSIIRIHRSISINLQFLRHYSKGKSSYVIMNNNTKLEVGSTYKEHLNNIISNFIS